MNIIDENKNKHIYSLNFNDESSGTRTLFALAPFLKRAFESTKTIVVDELEKSMHPALVEFIVKLFNDKTINNSKEGQWPPTLVMHLHGMISSPKNDGNPKCWYTATGIRGPLYTTNYYKYNNLQKD